MFKKHLLLLALLSIVSSCAQKKVTLYSKKYKIFPKINIPLNGGKQYDVAAYKFNNYFNLTTGQILVVERNNKINSNKNNVLLRVNPTQQEKYCNAIMVPSPNFIIKEEVLTAEDIEFYKQGIYYLLNYCY